MSFFKKILSPDDGSAKRTAQAAQVAQEAERVKLAEAQRIEGIETKKAGELAFKVAAKAKRRLGARQATVFTQPKLGVNTENSKVFLGTA